MVSWLYTLNTFTSSLLTLITNSYCTAIWSSGDGRACRIGQVEYGLQSTTKRSHQLNSVDMFILHLADLYETWQIRWGITSSNGFLLMRKWVLAQWYIYKTKFHSARHVSTRHESTLSTCRAHAFWLYRACRTARLDTLDTTSSTRSTRRSRQARLAT